MFVEDHQLWIKGDKQNGMPFGMSLEFVGNNTFTASGVSAAQYALYFEFLAYGKVRLTETYANDKGEKEVTVWMREM